MSGFPPVRQSAWDGRAAANFVCGGAGAGLIVFTALAGAPALANAALMLTGLALVGTGLLCVWHELGRPVRARNVFRHLRTSWMSREALAAALLVPATLAAAAGVPGLASLAAVLALAFIGCQAQMLQAARAIPAWRAPLVAPLLTVTALVEGAGLFLVAAAWLRIGTEMLLALFGALVLLRVVAWFAYRRAVASAPAPSLAALDAAGRVLQVAGTLLPLALIALIAAGVVSGPVTLAVAAAAGAAAAACGGWLKRVLILRAGYRQAVALAHLPVRSVRT